MWRAVFIFRQTEGSFRSFSGRKKTDGKPDGLPSAALAKVRRDENNLWSLAPEHDPNDMAGKDAVPTGQTAKRLMTTDDIAATIEANLHELKLPMGKTLLIETIREKIDASKAKAESALEMLCDKGVLKAMNYLLTEFIKQKSNDKRLAFLIMAIMEACKQYSVANIDVNPQFVDDYAKNAEGEPVLAGTEEDLVQQLLSSLHNETVRQRKEHPTHSLQNDITEKSSPAKVKTNEVKTSSKRTETSSASKSKGKGMLSEPFSKDEFDEFLDSLNDDPVECVSVFNRFSTDLAAQFVHLDTGKQFIFLQTLSRYRKDCRGSLDKDVWENLRKSVLLLSPKTIEWLRTELQRLAERKDLYIEYILQKIRSESEATKSNTAKLFVMQYLIKKLELL